MWLGRQIACIRSMFAARIRAWLATEGGGQSVEGAKRSGGFAARPAPVAASIISARGAFDGASAAI